jgi:hypothetical protein
MNKQFPNIDWDLANDNGAIGTWGKVNTAVLMDIRNELRTINNVLRCSNFLAIPRHLKRIAGNTTKKKKRQP